MMPSPLVLLIGFVTGFVCCDWFRKWVQGSTPSTRHFQTEPEELVEVTICSWKSWNLSCGTARHCTVLEITCTRERVEVDGWYGSKGDKFCIKRSILKGAGAVLPVSACLKEIV